MTKERWVAVIINTSAEALAERFIGGILGPVFGPYATQEEAQAAATQWGQARSFTLDISHATVLLTTDVQSQVNYSFEPTDMPDQ